MLSDGVDKRKIGVGNEDDRGRVERPTSGSDRVRRWADVVIPWRALGLGFGDGAGDNLLLSPRS